MATAALGSLALAPLLSAWRAGEANLVQNGGFGEYTAIAS